MSRKKGRRRKRARVSRENKRAMVLITIVVILLFFVLLFESRRLYSRIEANEIHRQDLEKQIEEETRRTEEIEALREYMQSDDYMKQAAKDRLGLVEEGEIIFKVR